MMKLAISGCQGRMGQRIHHLAREDGGFQIHTLLEHSNHPDIGQKNQGVTISAGPDALAGADVLIEFTTPDATMSNLQACVNHKVKMVIGSTGLNAEQEEAIAEAAKIIPVVYASNMSVGVNVLFLICRIAAEKLGQGYDMKVTEAHHVHKKDAPSGTAKTIVQHLEEGSGRKVSDVQSIREGEIVGDHEITLESPVDTITIKHHAKTRDIFAEGSLVAAKFLQDKSNGLFTMQDVLGIT